ncbi:MAG: hypothetical protein ACXVFL_03000 [Solirubrobacteraceae bacterium]
MRRSVRVAASAAAAALAIALPATAKSGAGDAPRAKDITATQAVLSDVVSGDGAPFTWHFEYGPTSGYGAQTPDVADPGHDNDKTVSATAAPLQPATTYHARLVWTIAGEREQGDDFSFTTPPAEGASAPADLAADPSDASGEAGDDATAPPPKPRLGRSAVAAVASGSVRVRIPGWSSAAALSADARIPLGSVLDTRAGSIRLTTALPGGSVQTATFRGGIFEVRQAAATGLIDLVLHAGSRRGCPAAAPAGARATALTRRRPRELGRLWGADSHGRYRTHGANSVATVRGTRWLTVERCDGTLTKVTKGAVSVFDRGLKRRVLVAAGHSYLAARR